MICKSREILLRPVLNIDQATSGVLYRTVLILALLEGCDYTGKLAEEICQDVARDGDGGRIFLDVEEAGREKI